MGGLIKVGFIVGGLIKVIDYYRTASEYMTGQVPLCQDSCHPLK